MNKLTAHDMRTILANLDKAKELTAIVRRGNAIPSYNLVTDADTALSIIREKLLAACVTDVAVDGEKP